MPKLKLIRGEGGRNPCECGSSGPFHICPATYDLWRGGVESPVLTWERLLRLVHLSIYGSVCVPVPDPPDNSPTDPEYGK